MDGAVIEQTNNETMETPNLIKQQLLDKAKNLKSRLINIDKDGVVIAEGLSYGKDDAFTFQQVQDEVLAAQRLTTKELDNINAALKKMADGKFGICENCGQKIDEARLKAIVTATHCRDCK